MIRINYAQFINTFVMHFNETFVVTSFPLFFQMIIKFCSKQPVNYLPVPENSYTYSAKLILPNKTE